MLSLRLGAVFPFVDQIVCDPFQQVVIFTLIIMGLGNIIFIYFPLVILALSFRLVYFFSQRHSHLLEKWPKHISVLFCFSHSSMSPSLVCSLVSASLTQYDYQYL